MERISYPTGALPSCGVESKISRSVLRLSEGFLIMARVERRLSATAVSEAMAEEGRRDRLIKAIVEKINLRNFTMMYYKSLNDANLVKIIGYCPSLPHKC